MQKIQAAAKADASLRPVGLWGYIVGRFELLSDWIVISDMNLFNHLNDVALGMELKPSAAIMVPKGQVERKLFTIVNCSWDTCSKRWVNSTRTCWSCSKISDAAVATSKGCIPHVASSLSCITNWGPGVCAAPARRKGEGRVKSVQH